MRRHNAHVCKVYKKVYQALASESIAARETADLSCRQARKYGINPDLSAWEIISAINQKNAQVQDKQYPRSDQKDNTGVKDKQYPPSVYADQFSQCVDGLKELGVDDITANKECAEDFQGKGIKIGKMRKSILTRLAKQYPALSKDSLVLIVENALREAVREENFNRSKKGVSPLQANSRHVYAASLNEAPAYLLIDEFQKGQYNPEEHNHGGIRSASFSNAEAWATINAHKNGQKIEESKPRILSASVNDVTPWRLTGSLADKRESTNRAASYLQKQNSGNNVKSAAATVATDDKPSWLSVMDNTRNKMGWTD